MSAWIIGVRSIGRNRRRTVVTTLAMTFAGTIMIWYSTLLEGFIDTLERNALLMELGELQVHAEGYREDPDLYTRIEDVDAVLAALEAEGVAGAPRLFGFGLAAAGASSAGVQIRGLDVPREARVTRLHTLMHAGEWLDESAPSGAVLGKKLAKTLRVDLGDEVVVVGQAADGSMANALYSVRGVLANVGDAVDRGGLFLTQSAFRELLVVPTGAHQIAAVRVERSHELDPTVAAVKTRLPGLDVEGWRELQPVLAQMMDTTLASQVFLLLITYIAVAMVVLNATLMSVFERIREFGVMRALGVSTLGVVQVVLLEVMGQATIAMGLAAGAGYALSLYFQTYGLDLSTMTNGASMLGVALDPVWYARITPGAVMVPVVSLVAVVLLAAIYPGVKAAVIPPAEAMRHI